MSGSWARSEGFDCEEEVEPERRRGAIGWTGLYATVEAIVAAITSITVYRTPFTCDVTMTGGEEKLHESVAAHGHRESWGK